MTSFIYYPREVPPEDQDELDVEPDDSDLDMIDDENELPDEYLEVELNGNRMAMVPVDLILFLADTFQDKIMCQPSIRLH